MLKFVVLYIHRRGFTFTFTFTSTSTSTTTINHQSVLPTSQGPPTRPTRTRLGSSHQHAGQPHHTRVIKQSSRHAKLLLEGLVWC